MRGCRILIVSMACGAAYLSPAPKSPRAIQQIIRGKHMSEETTAAAAKLAAFEQSKDVEMLRAAMNLLGRVDLPGEPDAVKRLALRKDAVQVWFALFAEIDRNYDPKFDPHEEFYVKITPPASGGVALPPGAPPELIKDPQARKQYEAQIKENDRKALVANFQTKLRRLDDLAMPNCERFLHIAYSSAPPDQNELSAAIKKLITNRSRAERLSRAGSGKQN